MEERVNYLWRKAFWEKKNKKNFQITLVVCKCKKLSRLVKSKLLADKTTINRITVEKWNLNFIGNQE